MRKVLFVLTLFLWPVVSSAQEGQLAQIRKLYAEAKQAIEDRKKAEIPLNETVVTSDYMAPGAGPIKDVTHYFYSGEFDENLGNVYYTPSFITRKYNVGAREYYEEMLFDKGSLVFFFMKSQNDETRYYWGSGGFFHEVVKGEKQMDEVFAARLSNDLKDAFDKLMNREF